jgi:Flp pilus assembly protein TadD
LAKLSLVSQAAVTFTAAPVQLDLATLLNDQGALASCGSIRSTPTPQAATSSQLRSDDLLALCQLARQYLDSGAAALALQIFQGLAAHAPQNPSVQLGLGLAADHLGDRELAERAYTRARALDPACPRAELNLVVTTLFRLGLNVSTTRLILPRPRRRGRQGLRAASWSRATWSSAS